MKNMPTDSRTTLREYYDAAAPNYLNRASKGLMGWLRKRELALTLDMIPGQGDRRTLDAGCGPGYYCRVLRDRGFDVTAVDISPEMVKTVKELRFPAYVMDIEHSDPPSELPVPFDLVFCAGVLEFAEDVRKFLGSLRGMASDDAELILIAPLQGAFGAIYRGYLRTRGIPAQVYSPKSLSADLKAVGFEPIEIRTVWPICLAVRARASKLDS